MFPHWRDQVGVFYVEYVSQQLSHLTQDFLRVCVTDRWSIGSKADFTLYLLLKKHKFCKG